ncbi:MAG: hypothetical protein AB1641_09535 [Thermodesulfobacteriota bacterium]
MPGKKTLPPGSPAANGSRQAAYQAPQAWVGIFYFLLAAWTAVSIWLLSDRARQATWAEAGQWGMIAFIIGYTWYFSLRISYRAELNRAGGLILTSYRRKIVEDLTSISLIEGPYLAIGFLRFRLAREKAYMFCRAGDPELLRFLWEIKALNPHIEFKSISPRRG